MAKLSFECVGAYADLYAVAPTIGFSLRITENSDTPIHAIALRCQIRIEPQRRRYSTAEAARLNDLFGDASRWTDTLRPLQFTVVNTMVPSFCGSIDINVPVQCTYDLEIAAARYFYALDDDAAPLLMLFSGTVFAKVEPDSGPSTGFQVEPVPWSAECGFRLPLSVWKEMVDRFFPNSGWLRLSRETLDGLARHKSRLALPTWDATIASLLPAEDRFADGREVRHSDS